MPPIKRFKPNMPSRKSVDSRSTRFASESLSTTAEEQIPSGEEHHLSLLDEGEASGVEIPSSSPSLVIEPSQLGFPVESNLGHTLNHTLPSSSIVRQPWKQENKQGQGYLGWAMQTMSGLMNLQVMGLTVVALGMAYYFFIYRKRQVGAGGLEEVEAPERKSEGPKSVRSSLKFKSPTMILSEIRKNPSVKVAPTIPKK